MKPLSLAVAAALTLVSPAQAQVRAVVGHFAPFADTLDGTQVDIAVNGTVALEDVVYGQFTDYLELGDAGDYLVEIFPEGSASPAITFGPASLADGDYTLLAAGDGVNQDLQIIALADDNTPPAAGNIKIRVVHAAPFGQDDFETGVSIRTDGGDVVGGLGNVPFPVASGYLEVPAGNYDLKVSSPSGNANFIDPVAVDLAAGTVATVVATGDGINQPLGITALPVGALPLENPTDATGTGLFFDPASAGQGVQAVVFPRQDRIVGFVYTFADDGSTQEWYHFDSCKSVPGSDGCDSPGSFDGISAEVTVYQSTGGAFNDGSVPATLSETGFGTVTLSDCNSLSFSGDLGNGAGEVTIDYVRLGDATACAPALNR